MVGRAMVTGGMGHQSHDVGHQGAERGECYTQLAFFFLLGPGDGATWHTQGGSFLLSYIFLEIPS